MTDDDEDDGKTHTATRGFHPTGGGKDERERKSSSDTSASRPSGPTVETVGTAGTLAPDRRTTTTTETTSIAEGVIHHTERQAGNDVSLPFGADANPGVRSRAMGRYDEKAAPAGGLSRSNYLYKSIIVIALAAVAGALYANFRFTRLAQKAQELGHSDLQGQLAMYPKDALEFNMRQRRLYQRMMQRRHNFIAIAVSSLSVLMLVVIAIYHRRRRAGFQKRKTVPFWLTTFAAVVLAVSYPAYLSYTRPPIVQMFRTVDKNPHVRFTVILAGIGAAALALLCCRNYMSRKRRRRHRHQLKKAFGSRKKKNESATTAGEPATTETPTSL